MNTRRDFLKVFAVTTAGFLLPDDIIAKKIVQTDVIEKTSKSSKPNIIFLLADDLGYADLGCTGSDLHQTPNIHKFKSGSLWFTNAYSSHCTCAPSRLGIMTGKYPAKLGVINNGVGNSLENQYTLAQAMKDAGYQTCHLGKWHIGNGSQRPELRGFDISIGSNQEGQPASYFYPFGKKGGSKSVPGLEEFSKGSHLTGCLTEKAIAYIKEHKGKPFYMHFCYYAVHTPIQAVTDKVDKYKVLLKPGLRHHNPTYAGLVEHLDDSVGRVLATLDEQGIAGNTIVVFFSDNGGATVTNNYPMRSWKGTPYEGGTRVPLFVRWKGLTMPGDVCDVPIIGHDFYPTFISMGGGKINSKNADIDGVDLTGLLKKTENTLNRSLHWLCYPLKVHYASGGIRFPFGAIRKGKYKLIENFATLDGKQKQGYEMYDLEKDPMETTNLADSMPEKFQELKKAMEAWRKDVNALVFDPHMYDGL